MKINCHRNEFVGANAFSRVHVDVKRGVKTGSLGQEHYMQRANFELP